MPPIEVHLSRHRRARGLPPQVGDGGGLRRPDLRPRVRFLFSCGGGADEPGEDIGTQRNAMPPLLMVTSHI